MFLAAAGCGKQSVSNTESEHRNQTAEDKEEQNMEEALVTREYLIEHCGISERDLEGIDVDAFIEEFDLKESNIDKVNVEFLLEAYKEEAGESSSPYSFFTEDAYETGGLKEEDIPGIQTAALYITDGTYQETIILDMGKEKGYWGKGTNLLYDMDEESEQITFTGEKREAFTKLLENCQVAAWKSRYEGTNEDTTGSFGWTLYLKMQSGKISRYTGSGVMGENRPEQWDDFEKGIKKLFEE